MLRTNLMIDFPKWEDLPIQRMASGGENQEEGIFATWWPNFALRFFGIHPKRNPKGTQKT